MCVDFLFWMPSLLPKKSPGLPLQRLRTVRDLIAHITANHHTQV